MRCRECGSAEVVKNGKSNQGFWAVLVPTSRSPSSQLHPGILHWGYLQSIKRKIADMAVNGSGIINTARVLKISPMIVTEELKKHRLHLVNKTRLAQLNSQPLEVLLRVKDPQPELDQIWNP